ncbi:MAG: fructosamine kinase, partial [Pseudonocardiaceae bacterium]
MITPAESVAAITGQPVLTATPHGVIWCLELSDGRTVVAKRAQPGQAMAEAAGLRWLRVPGGPPVPRVH